MISPTEVEVSSNWGISSDIIRGYQLRLLDTNHPPIAIRQFFPLERRMILETGLPGEPGVNQSLIEITAHEEAPVLCARLITETPLDQPFPEMEIRLGSTKGTNALLEYKGDKPPCWLQKDLKTC